MHMYLLHHQLYCRRGISVFILLDSVADIKFLSGLYGGKALAHIESDGIEHSVGCVVYNLELNML